MLFYLYWCYKAEMSIFYHTNICIHILFCQPHLYIFVLQLYIITEIGKLRPSKRSEPTCQIVQKIFSSLSPKRCLHQGFFCFFLWLWIWNLNILISSSCKCLLVEFQKGVEESIEFKGENYYVPWNEKHYTGVFDSDEENRIAVWCCICSWQTWQI